MAYRDTMTGEPAPASGPVPGNGHSRGPTARLAAVADAAHTAADRLDREGELRFAEYVHRAAVEVDRVGDYLRRKDVRAMKEDLEGVARSHPALFLAGAFVFGLALGRYLRSSGPEEGDLYDAAPGRGGHAARRRP